MNFTRELLIDIEKCKKERDFNTIIDELRNKHEIGIWGTGLAGTMIYSALKRLNISAQFFCDNNKDKIGTNLFGIKIRSINEISKEAFIIIAANVRYKIHEQLEVAEIKNYIYIDPVYLHLWHKENDIVRLIKENSKKIDMVYDLLQDEESKKVYKNVFLHRSVHNMELIWQIYDENQYFGNNVVNNVKGCFVDCGAFQGDTLTTFLKQINNQEYQYYAIEADNTNYLVLKNYCDENLIKQVYLFNLAIWDKKDSLYFESNCITGEVSGKVHGLIKGKECVEIKADSIDNIIHNKKIDYIKMDIEGAEINALEGARNSIVKSTPTLMISAYHEIEHLWEVPLKIKEIVPEYKIFFRHHMWNMADTVCYGIRG